MDYTAADIQDALNAARRAQENELEEALGHGAGAPVGSCVIRYRTANACVDRIWYSKCEETSRDKFPGSTFSWTENGRCP